MARPARASTKSAPFAAPPVSAAPHVSAADARLVLLDAQGLLDDPSVPATPARVYRMIERLGFVQLDTISVAERAHHHILLSRFDHYRAPVLARLQRDRKIFEHVTHDASFIPTTFFPHWRARFDRYAATPRWRGLAHKAGAAVDEVLAHVHTKGAVRSRDFEGDGTKRSGWWEWGPHKTALEMLWWTGVLAVVERDHFQKVFDLTERVYPEAHALPRPSHEEHVAWACSAALERLGVATPSEIAAFWHAISIKDATAWCQQAAARGDATVVTLEGQGDAKPQVAYAVPDLARRARKAAAKLETEGGSRMRILSPFDPVVRNRQRALRLFGFDYRFEAFVPAPQRQYGYYVLPVLEGDRFVARLDPKLYRDKGVLEVRGLWWEGKPDRARKAALDEALSRFGEAIGAERVDMPVKKKSR